MSLFIVFITLFAFSEKNIPFELHDRLHSPTSDFIFESLSTSASKEVIGICGVLYFGLGGRKGRDNLRPIVLGGAVTTISVVLIKGAVDRKRPNGGGDRWNSSFPSGHAALSFFVASYFGKEYSKLKIPLFLWAFGVGMSRVYLLRHWPSDVLVGAAIGYSVGKWVYTHKNEINSVSF